jgi:hypothetical protein
MPVTHELQYLCRTVTTQRTFSSLQTENHVYALTLAYLASKANTRNKVKMKKCANIQFKYEWHKCVSTRWVNEQKKRINEKPMTHHKAIPSNYLDNYNVRLLLFSFRS